MADAAAITYRAFLSYSHSDARLARRLHARLENFRLDKDLVGRKTAEGEISATLRPIFRDREDFSGGHSLNEATLAALDASRALNVLCSAVSATRPAVNEEVRLFRARHPDRRVIPVILDGSYPDNFPPALRFELNDDGSVSDRPITILGPDLREAGDGFDLSVAKIVAGLLGLAPDDVYRRAERTRRRQARLRNGIVAMIAVLIAAGGYYFYQSWQQRRTLAEIDALVAKYSSSEPGDVPGAKQSLTDTITAIAEGAATDPRYAKALALLKEGKPAEAEPLLKSVAEDELRRMHMQASRVAAAYRNLASIASLSDHQRARDYYAKAAQLDPDNLEGRLWDATFQAEAGQLGAAEIDYKAIISSAKPADGWMLFYARLGMGNLQLRRNEYAAAMASLDAAKSIADRLPKSELADDRWQAGLLVLDTGLGDLHLAQKDFAGALTSYRDGAALAQSQSQKNPNSDRWRFALWASYENVGNVLLAEGDKAGALKTYRDSLAIAEGLVQDDPKNVFTRFSLSVAHQKIADVLLAQGDVAGALNAYRDSLAIRQGLVKSYPDNSEWQHDLAFVYEKIGDVQMAQNDVAGAIGSYTSSLAIRDRLATADGTNNSWEVDRGIAYGKLAIACFKSGDQAKTLDALGGRSSRDSWPCRPKMGAGKKASPRSIP